MGFNSAFKGLNQYSFVCKTYKVKKQHYLGKEYFQDFIRMRSLKITDSVLCNEMAAFSAFMTRTYPC